MTNIMNESISGGNIMDDFILDPVMEYGGMFEDGNALLQQYLEEAITGTTKKNLLEKMLDLLKKMLKVISDTLSKIIKKIASLFPGKKVLQYTWDGSSDYVLFTTPDGKSCQMKSTFLNVCLNPEIVDHYMKFMEPAGAQQMLPVFLKQFIEELQKIPKIERGVTYELPIRNIEKLSKSVAKAIPTAERILAWRMTIPIEGLLEYTNILLGLLRNLSDSISGFYTQLGMDKK